MKHEQYFQYCRVVETVVQVPLASPTLLLPSNIFRVFLGGRDNSIPATLGPCEVAFTLAGLQSFLNFLPGAALQTTARVLLDNGISFPIHGPLCCTEVWGQSVGSTDGAYTFTELIMDRNPCDSKASTSPYPKSTKELLEKYPIGRIGDFPKELLLQQGIDNGLIQP